MGSKEAMEGAPTAKCRLALVDFIKKNNYKTGTGQWQLFAQPIEVKPNAVLYPAWLTDIRSLQNLRLSYPTPPHTKAYWLFIRLQMTKLPFLYIKSKQQKMPK